MIDKGGSLSDAYSQARTAGVVAAGTEAAVDLTLGKLGGLLADKLGNVVAKGAGKVVGETVTGGAQEGLASAAVGKPDRAAAGQARPPYPAQGHCLFHCPDDSPGDAIFHPAVHPDHHGVE